MYLYHIGVIMAEFISPGKKELLSIWIFLVQLSHMVEVHLNQALSISKSHISMIQCNFTFR